MTSHNSTDRARRVAVVLLAALLDSCNSTSDATSNITVNPPAAHASAATTASAATAASAEPEVRCEFVRAADGSPTIHYKIRNTGQQTIHVPDDRRMPYLIARGPSTLLVLHGVNQPATGFIYELQRRPLTRALEPGEELAGQADLATPLLHDHYAEARTPPSLMHGTIRVTCQVGWGTTAITEAVQRELQMGQLFAWQHMSASDPVTVVLP